MYKAISIDFKCFTYNTVSGYFIILNIIYKFALNRNWNEKFAEINHANSIAWQIYLG